MASILVAEDDELTRYLLELTLQQQGHEVHTANNGREAIQSVIVNMPDVIVLDLMMPGLNGMDVIRTIRNEPDYSKIHIIVITGTATPETYPETAQADRILQKPIPIDMLIQEIEHFL